MDQTVGFIWAGLRSIRLIHQIYIFDNGLYFRQNNMVLGIHYSSGNSYYSLH